MAEYHNHGVNLSEGHVKKIRAAHKKGISVTIRLSKDNLHGNDKLALTQTQINKIKKAKTGVQLTLSEAQLKHMEKTGGFFPLLTLIPIIASALGAAGGVAGGVASIVSGKKANDEQARHNQAEEQLLKEQLSKSGSGVVSDVVGKIPIIGSYFEPLLQKIGLGIKDITKLERGGCVKIENGLFLGSQGSGLFLGPKR